MYLTDRLGFKADLNPDTGEIAFESLKPGKVLERRLKEMKPVLAESAEIGGQGENIVHRLYRHIGDTQEITDSGLKFDITVVMPTPFGKELPKTTGHYHMPLGYAHGVQSPDFYQLIFGSGIILAQREYETADGKATAAYVINAEEMKPILLPPGMGHLTINTGDGPLVFANICVRWDHTDYPPYLSRKGGAFYARNIGSSVKFEQNQEYPKNTTLGRLTPNGIPLLERFDEVKFYPLLRDHTWALKFLTRPDHFLDMLHKSLKPE